MNISVKLKTKTIINRYAIYIFPIFIISILIFSIIYDMEHIILNITVISLFIFSYTFLKFLEKILGHNKK